MSVFNPGGGSPQVEHESAPADTRQARVDRLRARVDELFPGEQAKELRENIERSFLVPQVGDYHNEGMFMDSHLDVIDRTIDAVARGEFPDTIPMHARERMNRAVERDTDAVRRYVFLHDIAKADCLTITFADEKRSVTWEEWTTMLSRDMDGAQAMQGDEEALKRFINTRGIKSVSYFQNMEEGARKHGDIGAKELRAAGVVEDPFMLAAIETHEAAYQFANQEEDEEGLVRARADRYRKIFAEMPEEAKDFAMLASYVDTMGSLRADGNPNLTAFLALVVSREKWESLNELEWRLGGGAGLDKQKFDKAWSALRSSYESLPADSIDDVEARLREEAKQAGYNLEKLGTALASLVSEGTLTAEERDRLLDLAQHNPQGIGKAFGPKMRILKPVLNGALT